MKQLLTLLLLLFVATCYGVEKCSLEVYGYDSSYVSFGNTSCVLNGANIQTVEIWLYPIKEGETYADGIVFNSGWFDVDGAQKAFVLSVKAHDQILGYSLSRPSPSGKVSEIIIASQTGALKANKWTHVLWQPAAQQFYLDGVSSSHGTISGSVLSGISSFTPGDVMKVGQSFSGRLHALRLWSTLETYSQVLTHFNDMASGCDKGIGANVIGFWDFTVCEGHHVPAFKGNSCGRLHKKRGFEWVSETESPEIEFVNFANDSGHTWVDACSAESTCPTTCRTKHHHGHHHGHRDKEHHGHHDKEHRKHKDHKWGHHENKEHQKWRHHGNKEHHKWRHHENKPYGDEHENDLKIDNRPQLFNKPSDDHKMPTASILASRVVNVNLIFGLSFGAALLLVGCIVACICRCRNAKKSEKPQNESEVEQLHSDSDDEQQIPLGAVVSVEPVYIPLQSSE